MSSSAAGDVPGSDVALKAALHHVFDTQIPNYGDYNLVCASECGGTVTGQRRAAPVPAGIIVGYRRRPVELILTPFNRATLAALDRPVAIDLSNLAFVTEAAPGAFDIAVSTGRIITLTLRATCVLGPHSASTLSQDEDAADLASFLRDLADL